MKKSTIIATVCSVFTALALAVVTFFLVKKFFIIGLGDGKSSICSDEESLLTSVNGNRTNSNENIIVFQNSEPSSPDLF